MASAGVDRPVIAMNSMAQDSVTRIEMCSPAIVRRVAGMLDFDADPILADGLLPRGWQFPLIGADTRRSALRSDGFPGLGVTIPELGLPRLLLVARTVKYQGDIAIGQTIHRTSTIKSLTKKDGAAGPMATIIIEHQLDLAGGKTPVLQESQTFVMMQASRYKAAAATQPVPETGTSRTFTPDSTLLFQYSALAFNSHKIHIDRLYAREVEGYPDCVVNGGLTTLLLTEFARTTLHVRPREFSVRYLAPLFCDRAMTLSAAHEDGLLRLVAHDHTGRPAASMDLVAQ